MSAPPPSFLPPGSPPDGPSPVAPAAPEPTPAGAPAVETVPSDRPTGGAVRDPGPSAMGRGTLGRRLVLQVVALVALVAVALGVLTSLAVYQLMLTQLDGQVSNAAARMIGNGQRGGDGPRQIPGTLIVVLPADGNGTAQAVLLGEKYGAVQTLGASVVSEVQEASVGKYQATVNLDDLGRYRLAARDVSGGIRVVVGLPMTQIERVLAGLIGLEGILALLAMGGAALAARALVANSLRPLNRLAATATQVSELELGRGEVALAVRVDQRDADPRNEVGRVGQAFNHMLSNVDGALVARQASESKLRQFVADASHELRNPLAAIRGYAELTRRSRAEITPDAAFAMARVESEADRMSRLVEDMLLLARLDAGPNLDLGPTDLTETVINATSDARVAGPDHRWSLDLPDHPIVVVADRHRVHQVVANLLANARTHTPPGTSVQAGLRIEGDRAVISVTDDGPGVPPGIQGRVFERFTRADTSRARAEGAHGSGSTGLGLAIVSAVVEAHHGDVWVESRPGRTRFSIALPLAAAARADGPTFGG